MQEAVLVATAEGAVVRPRLARSGQRGNLREAVRLPEPDHQRAPAAIKLRLDDLQVDGIAPREQRTVGLAGHPCDDTSGAAVLRHVLAPNQLLGYGSSARQLAAQLGWPY